MIDDGNAEDIAGLPATVANASLGFDRATGVRATALMMAVKYHSETVIKDGTLYQQFKLDNKPITQLTDSRVLQTAVEFERYLRGDYAEMADALVGGDFSEWLRVKVAETSDSVFDEMESGRAASPSDTSPQPAPPATV